MSWFTGEWSRGDKLGAIGVVIAAVSAVAALLAIPGAPKVLHADDDRDNSNSTALKSDASAEQTELVRLQAEEAQREADIKKLQDAVAQTEASYQEEKIASPDTAKSMLSRIAKYKYAIDRTEQLWQQAQQRILVLQQQIANRNKLPGGNSATSTGK